MAYYSVSILLLMLFSEIPLILLPIGSFWGLTFTRHLPGYFIMGSAFFVMILVLLFVVLEKEKVDISNKAILSIMSAMIPILTVSFFLLRCNSAFLGDGAIIMEYLQHKKAYYVSNLADYLIHFFICNLLGGKFISPSNSYLIVGALAGLFFQVFCLIYLVSKREAPGKTMFLFLLLIFSGDIVFYYGYVESYTILFLLIQLYVLSSLSVVSNRSHIVTPLSLLLLSLIVHQISVLLLPSLAYLFYLRIKQGITFKESMACIGVAFLFAITIPFSIKHIGLNGGTYLQLLRERGISDFSAFLNVFNGTYSVFSLAHLVDFFNTWILSSPVSLVLLPPFLLNRRIYRDPSLRFIAAAAIFPLIFFFFMRPSIGMFRDWDLFSIPFIILTIMAVYLMKEYFYQKTPFLIKTLLLAVVLFHAGNWILVNHSKESSANRFKELIEINKERADTSLQAHNYELLADYYADIGDNEEEISFRLKAAYLSHNPRHFHNLANRFVAMGDNINVVKYMKELLELYPKDAEAYAKIATAQLELGDKKNAVENFKKSYQYYDENPVMRAMIDSALFYLKE
jgi:tetratricopeptide (TPR) repeat protein